MNLIFFDTETTGSEDQDRLIQLAYIRKDVEEGSVAEFNAFYKPSLPIKVEAMAVHHVTESMLEGKPVFVEAEEYKSIWHLFGGEGNYAIAHNAEFDRKMLDKEGVRIENLICTLKLARYLDTEGKIPSHALQYLRYFLKLEVDAVAHDALGDVRVLAVLFERLYSKIQQKVEGGPKEVLDEMVRISKEPSLIARFHFGKYKGSLIGEIEKTDRGYLQWLQKSEKEKESAADADLLHTLDYHLNPQARNKMPL